MTAGKNVAAERLFREANKPVCSFSTDSFMKPILLRYRTESKYEDNQVFRNAIFTEIASAVSQRDPLYCNISIQISIKVIEVKRLLAAKLLWKTAVQLTWTSCDKSSMLIVFLVYSCLLQRRNDFTIPCANGWPAKCRATSISSISIA